MSADVAPANLRDELRAVLADQRRHARRASAAYDANERKPRCRRDPIAEALASRVAELNRLISGDFGPIETPTPIVEPIAMATKHHCGEFFGD